MKNKYYNKNVLAIVAGILVTGSILNTVQEVSPSVIDGLNGAVFAKEYEQDIEYIQTTPLNETILEEAVSTRLEDSETLRKVNNIRTYLQKRNSPLADYAEVFVDAANTYGIDYRLVAAISIIESSGGLHTFRTYNAWGWGKMNFDSWEEGIWTVSKGLGNYYAKGADTPSEIARSYCPPSASSWASKVTSVMNLIGK
ncbi:hypothetical protein A3K02_01545 [candidate division WS6 bacterium RIFOXYD1_FULL_33_8]|nr:MAG: hypothetical protein A3K02_01545 [candidate division WS6 bacterium RIFOXYD1_FULL_33_8]